MIKYKLEFYKNYKKKFCCFVPLQRASLPNFLFTRGYFRTGRHNGPKLSGSSAAGGKCGRLGNKTFAPMSALRRSHSSSDILGPFGRTSKEVHPSSVETMGTRCEYKQWTSLYFTTIIIYLKCTMTFWAHTSFSFNAVVAEQKRSLVQRRPVYVIVTILWFGWQYSKCNYEPVAWKRTN